MLLTCTFAKITSMGFGPSTRLNLITAEAISQVSFWRMHPPAAPP